MITRDNLQLLNLKNLCTALKNHWLLDQDSTLMPISCLYVHVHAIFTFLNYFLLAHMCRLVFYGRLLVSVTDKVHIYTHAKVVLNAIFT